MPKGIIIGTVKDINNDDTDISSYAAIEPGTDIEKVTSVLILTSYSEKRGQIMSAKSRRLNIIIYCLIILGCDLLQNVKVFFLRFGSKVLFAFCL